MVQACCTPDRNVGPTHAVHSTPRKNLYVQLAGFDHRVQTIGGGACAQTIQNMIRTCGIIVARVIYIVVHRLTQSSSPDVPSCVGRARYS